MGYEEVPHTADWAIRVWAEDLAGLLVESARGMYALSGAQLAGSPRVKRSFECQRPDPESLLVSFLSELVYFAEQENTGFDQFEIELNGARVKVKMGGAPLKSIGKNIKAVTYHNLKIEPTARGLEAVVVFDV